MKRVPVLTCHRVAFPTAFERAGMNASMLYFQVVEFLFSNLRLNNDAIGFVFQLVEN